MYFEARVKNKKYSIEVQETRHFWMVWLQKEKEEKEFFKISRQDYKRMDDAVSFLFQNSSYMIDVVPEGIEYKVFTRGSFRMIPLYNDESLLHESLKKGGAMGGTDKLTAGMPGKIVEVFVKPGQEVKANAPLLIMEAMKMENEMRAANDTKIKSVKVEKGQSVESGAVLIVFENE